MNVFYSVVVKKSMDLFGNPVGYRTTLIYVPYKYHAYFCLIEGMISDNYHKTDYLHSNSCYKIKPSLLPFDFSKATDFLVITREQMPRERLLREGPENLSDRELLSILLNTGIKGKNVGALAEEVLEKLDASMTTPPIKELIQITGLGESKAAAIAAVLELGRRRWGIRDKRIRKPEDIYTMVRHYADRRQERFICISLNGAHEVLAVRVVTIGLVNKTIVHPREVFSDPLQDRASAICVAHNHPSGSCKPSPEDMNITRQLKASADILGISFLDHIIFTAEEFFSCQKHDLL